MDARPIKPVFRDEDELVPGQDLPERIRRGLEQSEFLIVVCSPNAAMSEWVEKEICDFVRLGRRQNILAVVVGGEPGARESANEALPRALRFHVEDNGVITDQRAEPLWIDWRQGSSRNDRAMFLRIVAALLSLESLDDLIRRDERARKRQRLIRWGVAAAFVAVAAGAFGTIISGERQLLAARSDQLARLAEDANARGEHESAMRYAAAGLQGADHLLLGFDASSAQKQIKAAWPHVARLAHPEIRLVTGEVSGFAISPDGALVAVSSGPNVSILRTSDGKRVCGPLEQEGPSDMSVWGLHFSPDGATLAVAPGRQVRLLDVATCTQRGSEIPHGANVMDMHFSPDGSYLLSMADDGSAKLSRTSDGTQAVPTLRHSSSYVRVGAVSRDGLLAATATFLPARVHVWNLQTGSALREPLVLPEDGWAIATHFSPSGELLMILGLREVRIMRLADGAFLALHRTDGDRFNTYLAAGFFPEERAFWTMDDFGQVERRVIGSDADRSVFGGGEAVRPDISDPQRASETSDDGSITVFTGAGAGVVYDTATGVRLAGHLQHGDAILDAEVTSDGTYIATLAELTLTTPRSIRVWHARVPEVPKDGDACALLVRLDLEFMSAGEQRAANLSDGRDFAEPGNVCTLRAPVEGLIARLFG